MKHLPPAVRSVFRRFARRKAILRLRAGAGWLAAGYILAVLAATHADRLLRFGMAGRQAAFSAVHLATAAGAVLVLLAVLVALRVSRRRSYEIEAVLRGHQEHLVSAYQLLGPAPAGTGRQSAEMLAILHDRSQEFAAGVHPATIVPPDRARKLRLTMLGVLAAACVVLACIPAYQFPLMLRRFYQPTADLPRPSFTRIEIGAYTNPAATGSDVTVPVRLAGWRASEAFLQVADPSGGWREQKMLRVGRDQFLHTFYDVQQDVRFRVRAGDGQSDPRELRVVAPPRVEALAVIVHPPAYTGLEPNAAPDANEATVLAGSSVEVRIDCPSAVRGLRSASLSASWADGNEANVPLTFDAGRAVWRLKAMTQDVVYRVRLTNREGFDNLDRGERRLLVVADQPPKVRLVTDSEQVAMFPTEERAFPVTFRDDYGLSALTLRLAKNPNPDSPTEPVRVPVETFDPPTAGGAELSRQARVNLESLGVSPGDVVVLQVEAMDINRQYGLSNPVLIRVVSFEPGLEEHRRIQTLRLLAAAFEALGRQKAGSVPAGQTGLDAQALQTLAARAEGLGVEPVDFADARALLGRLADEVALTDFHANRSAVRDVLVAAAGALMSDASAPARGPTFAALAENVLPAEVQYRFHRNLLRALGAFLYQLDRVEQANAQGLDVRKRTQHLRESVQKWMAYLSSISREARRPQWGYDKFEAIIETINTAAHDLDAGRGESIAALRDRLTRLRDQSLALLGPLAEASRQAAVAGAKLAGDRLNELLTDRQRDAAQQARDLELARLISHCVEDDPALAPAEALPELLLHRAAAATSGEQARKACRELLAANSPYVRLWGAMYRSHGLAALLADVRANHELSDWLRQYDMDRFTAEHAAATGQTAGDDAGLFAKARAQADGFAQLAKRTVGTDAATIVAAAGKLMADQQSLRKELLAMRDVLANVVPDSTLAERKRILAGCDELDRSAEMLLHELRAMLTNEALRRGATRDFVVGWTRVLVRLTERMEHFHSASAESMAILRQFDGKELDAKETALFPSRLNLIVGADSSIEKVCAALAAEPDLASPGPKFFAAEAERLALAGDIERLQLDAFALADAADANAASAREAVLGVLNQRPELVQQVVAEIGGPSIRVAMQQAQAAATLAGAAVTAGKASSQDANRIAAGLDATRAALSEARSAVEGLAGPRVEQLRSDLGQLLGELRGLDAADGSDTRKLNLLAFTLADAVKTLDALHRDLGAAGPPPEAIGTARMSIPERAAVESKRRHAAVIRTWQLAAMRNALESLRTGRRELLALAAAQWRAAADLHLAPSMLADPRALAVGAGGRDVSRYRLWIVEEFLQSLRLPLPSRHRTDTREYYDRLQEGFREHEHTR